MSTEEPKPTTIKIPITELIEKYKDLSDEQVDYLLRLCDNGMVEIKIISQ